MKGLFSIGEIASIKGVTVKALRYYDRIGLLKPFFVDESSGYRYYNASQMVQLDIIKAARALEISPMELIPYFETENTEGLLALLETHKGEIQERIQELTRVTASIEQISTSVIESRRSLSREGVYKKHIPKRHIVTLPYRGYDDTTEVLKDFSELDKQIGKLGGTATYETGMLYRIENDCTIPHLLFAETSEPLKAAGCQTLAEGEYICVSFSERDALDKQRLLNRYLTKNKLTPRTVVHVELLNELFDKGSPAIEIQLLAD